MKNARLAFLMGLGLFLGLSPAAWGVPMFARMYGYNCDTCHDPGYGQLNKFGFEFRAAGYRLPSDIGKDMNDGKFDLGNYMAARFSAGGSVKTTSQPGGPGTDNASFTLGGSSIFIGGGISKNFFAYNELGLGNGTGIFPGSSPSLSNANLGYVVGTEDEFFTLRLGKFSANGYGGSDRGPVGNDKISSAVKPTGTGLELGYTHQNTRVTLAFYDGIQSPQVTGVIGSNGKPVTSSTIQAPTSDSNNAKDFQVLVNQFIGDDGAAVNAVFYNGFLGGLDVTGMEYYDAALFALAPITKKLELKVGGQLGQTNAGVFAVTGPAGPTTGGFFGELDYEMDDITPLVFRYDYTTKDFNAPYQETQIFTLGALTPFVEHIYMNPTYSLTMTSASAGYSYVSSLTDSLNVFF